LALSAAIRSCQGKKRVISKPLLAWLLVGLVLLPIAIVLVIALAGLLSAMQDAAGASFLNRVALGLGTVWALGLIAMLLALAANSLADGSRADGPLGERSLGEEALGDDELPEGE